MPQLKTQQNDASVQEYLDSVDDEQQRKDALKILEMMESATGDQAKMWGDSIIGFGKSTYTTADGKEHQWFKIGFAPRKSKLSLYILNYQHEGVDRQEQELLDSLGRYRRGKSCLYIKRLSDVDMSVLNKLIQRAA